ncbi:outer membrane protein [Vibrio astriarenae]|nr:outer membrane protein [Vibrio sp. C7]
MGKYLVLLGILCAQASVASPYLGIRLGSTDKQESICLAESCAKRKPHAGLVMGYDVTNHFSVEAGIDYVSDVYGYDSTYLFNVMPGYTYRFTDRLAVALRAGISYDLKGSNAELNPIYSGRASYDINDYISLFYEVKAVEDRHDHGSLLYGLGLTYKFGTNQYTQDVSNSLGSSLSILNSNHVNLVKVADSEPEPTEIIVNFDFDSVTVIESELDGYLVDSIISKSEFTRVVISGHADNIGFEPYNVKLSKFRAIAVKDLLERKGITSEKIVFNYFGSSKPIANNETKADRARNRRVEIMFYFN